MTIQLKKIEMISGITYNGYEDNPYYQVTIDDLDFGITCMEGEYWCFKDGVDYKKYKDLIQSFLKFNDIDLCLH